MITEISLKGLKSFAGKSVSLKKLTILTGLNNSGKSTLIQALRMCLLSESQKSPYLDTLGGYSEIKSTLTNPSDPIEIVLKGSDGKATELKLTAHGYTFVKSDVRPFIEFISADRYGPRVQLPLISDDEQSLTVGVHGEFSAHYASIFENTHTNENLRHKNSLSKTLGHQVSHWIGEISPGVKLSFEVARRFDSSRVSIDEIRPTNCGYGISYALPIVLSLLSMTGSLGEDDSNQLLGPWFKYIESNGGVIIIENPEAHLHPKGQTTLGKLVAAAASCGVQVIVETHSDHFIDGVRLAVKQGSLLADCVTIKYLTKSIDTESHVESIGIKDDGKLEKWPEGFFDQQSINLRALSSRVPV